MKTVLFDLSRCQPIGESKFHGGGVYGYIVLEKLIEVCPENIVVYFNKSAFVPEDILKLIKGNDIPCFNSKEYSLRDLYIEDKYAVLYSPLWSDKYLELFPLNVPIVYTQHGLRVLEMNRDKNEWLYSRGIKGKLKALVKQTPFYKFIQREYYDSYHHALSYANARIITVSNHSKSSILFHYPFIEKSRISVCYSPDTTEQIQPSSRLVETGYYLIVSANRWLKNSLRAMIAFDRIIERNLSDKKMMVIGLKPSKTILGKLKNIDNFIFLPYLDRSDLESAYKYAYTLIYPSLNEGFGYPPLEAMKYGVPVIASSFSSIPEVCGEAVIYANPYSIDEIAMRIIQMEDITTHKSFSAKAIERQTYIANIQHDHLNKLVSIIQDSIK